MIIHFKCMTRILPAYRTGRPILILQLLFSIVKSGFRCQIASSGLHVRVASNFVFYLTAEDAKKGRRVRREGRDLEESELTDSTRMTRTCLLAGKVRRIITD